MTYYVVKPSSIASVVSVTVDGKEYTFIYLAPGKDPEPGIGQRLEWKDLPGYVRAHIEVHYNNVFNVPIEKRGEYLKTVPEKYFTF